VLEKGNAALWTGGGARLVRSREKEEACYLKGLRWGWLKELEIRITQGVQSECSAQGDISRKKKRRKKKI